MTLKELHDSIPAIVAENMGEIDKAESYAQNLLTAADNEVDREGSREVIRLVQARREQIGKLVRGCQNTVHQIAVFAHKGQDFESKV